MKKIGFIAVWLGFAGSVFATDIYYTAQHQGGDAATWEDANNWNLGDYSTVQAPTSSDNARIMGHSWIAGYPTLSTSQSTAGLFMGLETGASQTASLNITASGSLAITADDGWNDGIQLGWYSDSTITSAGTVTTMSAGNNGDTLLGAGDGVNGYGNTTLNITDGSWSTAYMIWQDNSVNHVQLDGGVLDVASGMWNLQNANQTLDITGAGTLVYHSADANWFDWIKDLGLTGNGLEDNANIQGIHDGSKWTITAVPEPATLGLIMLSGGLLWVSRRYTA